MTQEEFLQRVNEALDPKSFFAEMGEGTVGDVTEETSLPCPLCQTPTPLNINWETKRAACVNPQCVAHQPKPLFDIVLSQYHQSPFVAALAYVGKHNFPWKGDECDLFLDDIEEIKQSCEDSLLGALEGFLVGGLETAAKELIDPLVASFDESDGRTRTIILNAFSRLTREFPESVFLKEASAVFRLKAQDLEGYARDVEALARLHLGHQNEEGAKECLDQLIEHKPNHLYARETLARICGSLGEVEAQAEHLMATVDCLSELELFDRIHENLQLLSALPVSDAEMGLNLAQKMSDFGMISESLDIYFGLAKKSFESGDEETGSQFLTQILELAPQDEEYIDKIVSLLMEMGNVTACITLRCRQVQTLNEFGLGEDALRIGRKAMEQFGRCPELLDACYQIVGNLFSPDDAISFLMTEWNSSLDDVSRLTLLSVTEKIAEQCQDAWELKEILAAELVDVDDKEAIRYLIEVLDSDHASLDVRFFAFLRLRQVGYESDEFAFYQARLRELQGDSTSALTKYCELGFNFLRDGNIELAQEAMNRANSVASDDQSLNLLNALVHHRMGEDDKAEPLMLDLFQESLKRDDLNWLQEVKFILESIQSLSPDEKTKLAEWYEKYGYDDFAAREYSELAASILNDGDWEDARQVIDQALDLDGTKSDYWAVKGEILTFIGDETERRDCWEQAAHYAVIEGDFERGLSYLEKSKGDQYTTQQNLLLAEVYQGLKTEDDERDVRLLLKDLLAENDDKVAQKNNLQRLMVLSPNSQDLLEEYISLLESHYDETHVLTELSSLADKLVRDHDKMECLVNKTISLYPFSIVAQEMYLGYIYVTGEMDRLAEKGREFFDGHLKEGNLNSINRLYKKVRDWLPHDPRSIEMHGDYELYVENSEEAVSLWDKAFKGYSSADDFPSMIRVVEKKIEALEDNLAEKEYLACLYARKGNLDKAIEIFSLLISQYHDQEKDGENRLASLVDSCIVSLDGDWDAYREFAVVYEEYLGAPASHEVIFQFIENTLLSGKSESIVDACQYLLSSNGLRSELAEQCTMFLVQFGDQKKASESYRQLIVRYEFDNNLEEALRLCETARDLLPDDFGLKVIWNRLRLSERSAGDEVVTESCELYEELEQAGEWSLAAELAELLCQAKPDEHKWFIALGEAKFHAGSSSESSAILRTFARDKAGTDYQASREAYEKYISLFDHHGNELKALIQLIIENDDKIPLEYTEKMILHLMEEHVSDEDFEKQARAISAKSEDPIAAESLYIEAVYDLGLHDKARQEMEMLACSLSDNESFGEAFALYEKLCIWFPEDIDLNLEKAKLAEKTGNGEEAFASWRLLVDLYGAEGNWKELVLAAEKALEFDPTDRHVRLVMAESLYEQDEEYEAKKALWEIVHQNNSDELYEANISILERIIEYFDDVDHSASLELARIYKKVGSEEGSRSEWKTILTSVKGDDPDYIKYAQEAHLAHKDDEYLWSVYLHALKELGEYSSFVTEAKGLVARHLQQNEIDLGVEILEDACQALIECREFSAVSEILAEFRGSIDNIISIQRYRALAFEGEEKDKDASYVWRRIADLYQQESNHEGAVNALRRSVALTPSEIELRESLIEVLSQDDNIPAADLLLEYSELVRIIGSDRKSDVLSIYAKMLDIDDENISLYKDICELYIDLGQINDAVPYMEKYGALALSLGIDDTAREVFEQLLDLAPENVNALEGLIVLSERQENRDDWKKYTIQTAEICEKQHEFQKALDLWKQIFSRYCDDLHSLERLSELELEYGEPKTAQEYFVQLVELYRDSGKTERILTVLGQLLQIDPGNPSFNEQVGDLYFDDNDPEKATPYLVNALKLYKEQEDWINCQLVYERFKIVLCQDLDSMAIIADSYEKINQSEKASEIRYQRSLLFNNSGDLDQEMEELEIAFSLNSENDEVLLRLIDIYHEKGMDDKAEKAFCDLIKESLNSKEKAVTEKYISKALEQYTASLEIGQLAARFYVDFGEKGKAIQILWRIIQEYKDSSPEKSIELLKDLVELDQTLTPVQLAFDLATQINNQKEKQFFAKMLTVRTDKMGSDDERMEAHKAYLSINPSDQKSLEYVVGYYKTTTDSGQAFDYILKAVEALLGDGDAEAAEQLVQKIKSDFGFNIDQQVEISKMYLSHEIPEMAIKEYIDIARKFRQQSNNKDALCYLDKALEIQPTHFSANKDKFSLLVQIKEYSQALPVAENILESLRKRNDKVKEHFFIKELLNLPLDTFKPYEWLERYVVHAPQNREILDDYRILAEKYKQQGSLRKAEQFLQAALSIVPEDIDTLLALIDLKSINETNFESAPYYMRLAKAYDSQGTLEKAKNILEFLIERGYERQEVLSLYYKVLIDEGENTRAYDIGCDLACEYIKHSPEKAEKILRQIKDFKEASGDFLRLTAAVHKARKSNGLALQTLEEAVNVYEASDDRDSAIETIREILQLDQVNLMARKKLVALLKEEKLEVQAANELKALAKVYETRGLIDLACESLEEIIQYQPDNREVWEKIFKLKELSHNKEDLIQYYLKYAKVLADQDIPRDSIDYYLKVIEQEPRNLDGHRGYISQYPKIGKPLDIVDGILAFAQILLEEGEVDESLSYFELVMSLDPSNAMARDVLSSTQSKDLNAQDVLPDILADIVSGESETFKKEKSENKNDLGSEFDVSETQRKMLSKDSNASDLLMGALDQIEMDETKSALMQIEQNYRDILSVNPQNGNVRVRLADVLGQMGQKEEMLTELMLASEIFLTKNELANCAEACQKYLKVNPTSQQMRKRLNDAVLKRDAFKALESAILFTDRNETNDTQGRKTTDS